MPSCIKTYTIIRVSIKLIEYIDLEGKNHYRRYLAKLKDKTSKAQLLARVARLIKGNFGDHRNLRDGIFELKLHFGKGHRIYGGRDGDKLIVLLLANAKTKKKEQDEDIAYSSKLWAEYLQRKS